MKSSPEYIAALHALYAAEHEFGEYEMQQGEDFVDPTDPRCIELRTKIDDAEANMIAISISDYERAYDLECSAIGHGVQS